MLLSSWLLSNAVTKSRSTLPDSHSQANTTQVLLVSGRNAPWMNASLIKSTACTKIFHSSEVLPNAQGLKQEVEDLGTFDVPSLELLLEGKSKPFPFDKTFESAKWDPILILHSSGSTGRSTGFSYVAVRSF